MHSKPPFTGATKMDIFKAILSVTPGSITFPNHFQTHAKDLISKLLVLDPANRLGAGGVQEVMCHPWFRNIDWDALYQCGVPVPVTPGVSSISGDTRLFPHYSDTEMPLVKLHNQNEQQQLGAAPADIDDLFRGF